MGLPVGGTTSLRRRAWRRSPDPSVIEQEDSDRGLVVKFGLATVVWLSSAARDGEHVEYRHRRTVCGRHRHACVVKLDVDEARRGAALILPEENGDAASVTGDRKSVVEGKSVSVRVDLGGRRIIKKKKKT